MTLPSITHLGGRRVLFVMATEAEYGPRLKAMFTPLMTGVGPVETGLFLGSALTALKAAGALPELIVSLGSAGSRRLPRTGLYQVSAAIYRDMDATAFGFGKGVTPFLDQPAVLTLPWRIPGVPEASISTGATIIAGSAFADIAEDMVDMETFACMRASQVFGVPLIGLRGISDGDTDVSHIGDWTEYLHVIDEKLADVVALLGRCLEEGTLETRADASRAG
ncbi:MAG: 5'-methylthioadenosine/S-adenosylhomocysteine nucleosidase [Rhizobiaceae bacterium]